jgi:hypothetical protein
MSTSLQRRRDDAKRDADAAAPPLDANHPVDAADRLRRLEALRTEGLVTSDEYDAKRAEILALL